MTRANTETSRHDVYGKSILQELAPAKRFSQWMYEAIEPYLGSRILEIGSGIGNISRQLPLRDRLTLSDYDAEYRAQIEKSFGRVEKVNVIGLDLTSDASFEPIQGQYDSIVCLNVLEHIEDDCAALRRMRGALEPGGRLIVLVPQYRVLMSNMDRLLGHYRRYGRAELGSKLEDAGLRVAAMKNFNSLGLLGWSVSNTLMGNESLGIAKVRLFDALVPVVRPIERLLPLPGLSVIGVGERQ